MKTKDEDSMDDGKTPAESIADSGEWMEFFPATCSGWADLLQVVDIRQRRTIHSGSKITVIEISTVTMLSSSLIFITVVL